VRQFFRRMRRALISEREVRVCKGHYWGIGSETTPCKICGATLRFSVASPNLAPSVGEADLAQKASLNATP
jgi:hypothetical protein